MAMKLKAHGHVRLNKPHVSVYVCFVIVRPTGATFNGFSALLGTFVHFILVISQGLFNQGSINFPVPWLRKPSHSITGVLWGAFTPIFRKPHFLY